MPLSIVSMCWSGLNAISRVDELLNGVDDQVMQDEQGPVDEYDDCA
jgi:hypothetical protein